MRPLASRSLHGAPATGLGVLPVVLVAAYTAITGAASGSMYAILGGSTLASIWAWNDPDFFRSLWFRADVEQKMALLNNQWQALWKAAGRHGLGLYSPSVQLLNTRMGQWVEFKKSYDTSIIGQMPYPLGEDWNARLDTWLELFEEARDEIAEAGGTELAEELKRSGVDPRVISPDPNSPTADSLKTAINNALKSLEGQTKSKMFWPIVGAGAFTLAFIWLATRPQRV